MQWSKTTLMIRLPPFIRQGMGSGSGCQHPVASRAKPSTRPQRSAINIRLGGDGGKTIYCITLLSRVSGTMSSGKYFLQRYIHRMGEGETGVTWRDLVDMMNQYIDLVTNPSMK